MTFARLAKLLAVVLVAVALWRARPPAEPARVAVLALPGAARELVTVGAGAQPAGEIRVPPQASGASFWRHLLAVTAGDGADAAPAPPLWAGERAAVRAVAVPARLFAATDEESLEGRAFLGSSSGALVEATDITSGRLPFPYDRAVDAVAAAVGTLGKEQWSEWLEVPPVPGTAPNAAAPVAEFQFARYTDSTYYFSPAYIRGNSEVVGDGFLRGLDRELRPVVATHVIGLAHRRVAARRDLFRTGGDQRPAVVFDDVAEDATTVFAPDSSPSAVAEQIRQALTGSLAALRESVGKDGIVLIVGGPPTTRQTGVPAWYRVVRGSGGDTEAWPSIELASAASIVRYLGGISLDSGEKARLPLDLARRFPIRATALHTALANPAGPPAQQWTASALESVPGAVSAGN